MDAVKPSPRARQPDRSGTVVAPDGVEIAWEVFGDGPTTVLLMPTWSIIHSRFWKAQVPFLARHHRVVTFDGRGSGASGRPSGPASYGHDRWVADTLAVMEATGTEQAVLVALSRGAAWSLGVAADHPERVLGLFLIGSSPGFAAGAPQTAPGELGAAGATTRRAGRSTTGTTGSTAARRTSSRSSSTRCSPSRTPPSRSRTASAGPARRRRRCWSTPPPPPSASTAPSPRTPPSCARGCAARWWSCTAPTTGSARPRSGGGSPSSPAARWC